MQLCFSFSATHIKMADCYFFLPFYGERKSNATTTMRKEKEQSLPGRTEQKKISSIDVCCVPDQKLSVVA